MANRVRVLVVDDYFEWRSVVCATLGQQPHLCIAGEAADGSEAVRKIEVLLPDLIVLDIGLPKLNGLEVASRACELSPDSKVLIVSETRSAAVAEEAFRRGALGYVVKSGAASELLPAVERVLQGKPFISTYLIGRVFDGRNEALASLPAERPAPARRSERRPRHEVEFYPEEAAYLAGLTRYIESVLGRGDPVVVFATAAHRARVRESLKGHGVDINTLIDCGRLVLLDSHETLSAIMVDDKPDAVRCDQALRSLIAVAAGNSAEAHPHVAFCGQCSPVLLSQGNTEGAIQLEHMWDEIASDCGADTLCGYISSTLPVENRQEVLQRICAEHSSVYGLESSKCGSS